MKKQGENTENTERGQRQTRGNNVCMGGSHGTGNFGFITARYVAGSGLELVVCLLDVLIFLFHGVADVGGFPDPFIWVGAL